MEAGMPPGSRLCCQQQAGFTYTVLLFALVLLGVGLAAIGEAWSAASRRDKERELLYVGNEYVRAIRSFYEDSPGEHRYPASLADLVEDRRFVDVRRHLRRLYPDPVDPALEWRLLPAPDGGVMGVASQSRLPALARQPARLPGAATLAGTHYSDWAFAYVPRDRPGTDNMSER
jgi:type II secretory pathway pseudopilin PulG